jgi:hypothetical protein
LIQGTFAVENRKESRTVVTEITVVGLSGLERGFADPVLDDEIVRQRRHWLFNSHLIDPT